MTCRRSTAVDLGTAGIASSGSLRINPQRGNLSEIIGFCFAFAAKALWTKLIYSVWDPKPSVARNNRAHHKSFWEATSMPDGGFGSVSYITVHSKITVSKHFDGIFSVSFLVRLGRSRFSGQFRLGGLVAEMLHFATLSCSRTRRFAKFVSVLSRFRNTAHVHVCRRSIGWRR